MPTNTTRLESVNTMLATIGEAPVNSITGTLPLDASLAKTTLDEITREVLAGGWHFNTFYDYTLSLDVDSKIPLAGNILRVDLDVQKYAPTTYDVVRQGDFLYNKKDNTFTFDKALDANVVIHLEFEDLPENARRYITIRAARIFQDRSIGATDAHGCTIRDEAGALAALREEEGLTGDHSIFNNNDTFQIINRKNVVLR